MPIRFLKHRTEGFEIEKPVVASATPMSPLATLTILFDGKAVVSSRLVVFQFVSDLFLSYCKLMT